MSEIGEAEIAKKTSCRSCNAQCAAEVIVKGGRAVRIQGDSSRENPVARGRLCVKGANTLEMHQHPGRLNYPLKRAGKRGEGRWEQVSWKQAMDDIAANSVRFCGRPLLPGPALQGLSRVVLQESGGR